MFKESSIRSFRLGNFKKCNILLGYKSSDSFTLIPGDLAQKPEKKSPSGKTSFKHVMSFKELKEAVQNFYQFYPTHPYNNSDLLLNSVFNEYTKLTATGNHEDSHLLRSNYYKTFHKIVQDESFACPAQKLVDNVARQVKVFLYVNSASDWNATAVNSTNAGVELLKRWANFVRFDSPNQVNVSDLVWPAYELPVGGGGDSHQSASDLHEDSESTNSSSVVKVNDSMYFSLRNSGNEVNKMTHLGSCNMWNYLMPAQLDILGKKYIFFLFRF
jgi:hypothetical protein